MISASLIFLYDFSKFDLTDFNEYYWALCPEHISSFW